MSKVVKSLQDAVKLCGLQDGMTVSITHNLRLGDQITGEVLRTIHDMGFHDIRLNSSGGVMGENGRYAAKCIEDGVITRIDGGGLGKTGVANTIQRGNMKHIARLTTHGGRPKLFADGFYESDLAFIYAPCCDKRGNCNGRTGNSAFGSMGYAMTDARHAKKVIVITDGLSEAPIWPISIDQTYVDYVVEVENLGDPQKIAGAALRITRDPISLLISEYAQKILEASGYIKDGFTMQAGSGGISLAVTSMLKEYMAKHQVCGEWGMGGITTAFIEMMHQGLFKALYDVQCFDTGAIESMAKDPNHIEISASMYANPDIPGGCLVNDLDTVILSATEIDVNFNVNVHTDSLGNCIAGAGGHGDTAQGAKLSIVCAPAYRSRLPMILDRVTCISTPGENIDVFVCQLGIAVNTALAKNADLFLRLKDAKLPVYDIHELQFMIEKKTGKPKPIVLGNKVVADILWRDGTVIDHLYTLGDYSF
jgi:citrate lyase subunit alpha/citrate CoA-transferase